MKVIRTLDNIDEMRNLVIALGNFDGVHRGHRHLIEGVVSTARKINGTAGVLTFDPHPAKVLKPEASPGFILTPETKLRLIAHLGVDLTILVPFDEDLARIEPTKFIENILWEKLRPSVIYVGFNYTFGKAAKGRPELLKRYGEKLNFEVKIVPPVMIGGVPVSSTLIREMLVKGDISRAKDLLGYWPILEGKVVSGDQKGREIGFPTANLAMEEDLLLPARGVYAAWVIRKHEIYKGIVNIGYKPTFGERSTPTVEVHIFDLDEDLYGQSLELRLRQRIRPEKKFPGTRELAQQIRVDIETAKEVLREVEWTFLPVIAQD
ncbi:bifunctional riboflavin kinase/FAD synthetase [Calderihabitans maritimus]|uniref:Riboflavin biosynthesis protein n=1 Tax=Calderihabitans maritimus TaxID=1246530 RepID=A0A1Z5HXP0_9FIRM|nr:bifunctional riboflavin kinase/FAD synthetase [Calderihabitans maritimus]GAW94299.1 riboflavin biosynthesis protein RibF [Calderihabitans maritimus]